MPFSLAGHVAVVTGSTTGLGKAIALTLGRAGAKVAVNYFHNDARAERTFAEFKEANIPSTLVKADVVSEEGVERLFRETEVKLGKPDILVVNATPEQPMKPVEEYDWAFCQTMLDFFVKSPFLLTRRGLASMKAKKWGRIVNITSEVFHLAVAPFSAYVAAKGGQIGWSRSIARELAPFGITVNMVAPGWIPDRWGTPQDVADAVLYLASEEASFVTGQTISVNGGMTPW
jgi:3-oxoacyl-[acyl-carrier protein] reductase